MSPHKGKSTSLHPHERDYRFIDALPQMVTNCNSSVINYLTGDNLGFASSTLDTGKMIYGLVDHHSSFEVLSGEDKDNKLNSISVPEDVVNGMTGLFGFYCLFQVGATSTRFYSQYIATKSSSFPLKSIEFMDPLLLQRMIQMKVLFSSNFEK